MKVYFTASQRGKKLYLENYKQIADALISAGFELIDDDLIKVDPDKFYEELEGGGMKAFTEFYEKELEYIQAADINVFDCTAPSLSIGFIIEKSLERGKPTVVLYSEENMPFFLAGITDDKLILKSYNKKGITKAVLEAVSIAREQRDVRFNFFISNKLLMYLEDSSQREGITKSKFIRNLITEHRRLRGNAKG